MKLKHQQKQTKLQHVGKTFCHPLVVGRGIAHDQSKSRTRDPTNVPRRFALTPSFLLCRRRSGSSGAHSPAPSYPHRSASPEGSQVNVMGVHTVPGSPNTLHRTVATNTPPSPALQRRLGQASPSLARHQPAAGTNRDNVPSSPLIGRNAKTAAAGVPPSPLMGRRTGMAGRSTPDDIGPQPLTPAFPVSPQLPEKRHMSTGDVERTDTKNLMAGGGSSAPNLSGTHISTDVPKSIYGEMQRPSSIPTWTLSAS